MSTYECTIRTNYFHVKDAARFKKMIEKVCVASGELHLYQREDEKGKQMFAFGCFHSILGFKEEAEDGITEYDYDGFLESLQECVADDDAVIIYEAGHEKLSYIVGEAVVLTAGQSKRINLENLAAMEARKMLGLPFFSTVSEY